jgi:hypothetical protein
MKNKQGLRPCINLYVQLLDILADSAIDIPAAVNARVDMAYRGLSSCLFELILSQEEDLNYKQSVIKKFVSSLLFRTFALLKEYGPVPEKSGMELNVHQSVLIQVKAGLLRILQFINYQPLEEIFLELDLVYRRILKQSL